MTLRISCSICGFGSDDPDDAGYFLTCPDCSAFICDDCGLTKHRVVEHKMEHQHEYEMTDCDEEADRVRYTCELCGGGEYMITYTEYRRAIGKPIE